VSGRPRVRILVASDQWFPDFRGGSARVASETARGLARRGHEVTVLAPRVPSLPPRERDGRLTLLRCLRRNPLPKTITDVVEAARASAGLRRKQFDVVVAHQSTVAVGVHLARLGAPNVYVFHASPARELRFLRSRLGWGKARLVAYGLDPFLVAWERIAVRRADSVIILSEFSRSLLREDHPSAAERAVRIPGGVDVERFSPGDGKETARERLGLPRDRPLLVTVRRLSERMGIEELLYAVARLNGEGAPLLAVVGSGELEVHLRRIAGEVGLGPRIRFVGSVGDEELPDWYRAADLFVLPTVAYEGFGMATLESLVSGTPVVGTAVGATPELLAPLDGRLVAESPEPHVLAEAIRRALDLAGDDLRRRCREYACEHFSWERIVKQWEEALRPARRS
jgi:glycosyltransferase involved in cell wall biosynthesis